jgi:hypothetical protein
MPLDQILWSVLLGIVASALWEAIKYLLGIGAKLAASTRAIRFIRNVAVVALVLYGLALGSANNLGGILSPGMEWFLRMLRPPTGW